MDVATFIVGAIGALLCIPPALQSLGLDVRIFGRKEVLPQRIETRKLRWAILLAVASIALTISAIGLYRTERLSPDYVAIDKAWGKYDYTDVWNRNFSNEDVQLDGRKFHNCHFENVTFVYEGTAPFSMNAITATGKNTVRSANPIVKEVFQAQILTGGIHFEDLHESPMEKK